MSYDFHLLQPSDLLPLTVDKETMLAWQRLVPASVRNTTILPSSKCRPTILQPAAVLPRYTSTKRPDDLSALLQQPSWSVRSLLPSSSSGAAIPQVTPKQLHHLLRLSALPLPASAEEEAKMLKTLETQLHFVREIQQVDTTGVAPLRALRDETEASGQEQTIHLRTLEDALSKEQFIGKHYKRVKRKAKNLGGKEPSENWDPLPRAQQKAGSYFIVENEKA